MDVTPEDFRDLIFDQLRRITLEAAKGINAIHNKKAANGSFNSGGTIKACEEFARDKFEQGIEIALSETQRAIKVTTIDEEELEKITRMVLENFKEEMKEVSSLKRFTGQGDALDKKLFEMMSEYDRTLKRRFRQYETGLYLPKGTANMSSSVDNSVTIGSMTGSSFQSHSPGATMNFTSTVDLFQSLNKAISRNVSDEVIRSRLIEAVEKIEQSAKTKDGGIVGAYVQFVELAANHAALLPFLPALASLLK